MQKTYFGKNYCAAAFALVSAMLLTPSVPKSANAADECKVVPVPLSVQNSPLALKLVRLSCPDNPKGKDSLDTLIGIFSRTFSDRQFHCRTIDERPVSEGCINTSVVCAKNGKVPDGLIQNFPASMAALGAMQPVCGKQSFTKEYG